MSEHVTTSEETPHSTGAMLEQATKGLALVALVSYTLGLVITNTYLYYSGVSEFELFRPRFITIGLLAISPLVLSAIGWLALLRWAPAVRTSSLWRKAGFVLATFTAIMPLLLMLLLLRNPNSERQLRLGNVLLIYCLGLAVSAGFLSITKRAKGGNRGHASPPFLSRSPRVISHGMHDRAMNEMAPLVFVWVSLLVGAALVWWILLFAKQVFPRIPEQFGGARAKLVQLLVDESAASRIDATGIQFSESSLATCRVGLLFQGSDFYLVRKPGSGDEISSGKILLSSDDIKGLVINGGPVC